MEPIFIVVEHDCWSLFVGVVIAFTDNSRLVEICHVYFVGPRQYS